MEDAVKLGKAHRTRMAAGFAMNPPAIPISASR